MSQTIHDQPRHAKQMFARNAGRRNGQDKSRYWGQQWAARTTCLPEPQWVITGTRCGRVADVRSYLRVNGRVVVIGSCRKIARSKFAFDSRS